MNKELLKQLKNLLQQIIRELEIEEAVDPASHPSDPYIPWRNQTTPKPWEPYRLPDTHPWIKPIPQWPNYPYDNLTPVEYGCIPLTTIYEGCCNAKL